MPRKPKLEKHTITVIVNGAPINVILHPPANGRTSWYAYWAGLVTSKSTGQRNIADAIVVVENMVRNGGDRSDPHDAALSDEEFVEIQRVYFGRRTDAKDQARSRKTLKLFLEAKEAFQKITELKPIASATADACAKFQRVALTKPKNWQQQHPKSKADVKCLSPNTILKWSRSLQAAFERANRNAGRKCVRGVVDARKLLTVNPWNQFEWIEGVEKPVRQLSHEELLSILDFLESEWNSVTVGALLAKIYLWSCCRQTEATTLTWDALREIGGEYHFEFVGKRAVKRWFRIPASLHHELCRIKIESPFLFAAYNAQLRHHHDQNGRPEIAAKVGVDFKPNCLGDWFYDRLADWSASHGAGHVHPHIFRKTALQSAWIGDDEIDKRVAYDAGVGKKVLMAHYVTVLREKSNRTFRRILEGLPSEVLRRFGHVDDGTSLAAKLQAAHAAQDWATVKMLAEALENEKRQIAVRG